MSAPKRWEEKIGRIRDGSYRKGDFILADAKDADMSGGILATGPRRNEAGKRIGWRTRPQFLAAIESILDDGVVDIMLLSAGNLDRLDGGRRFDGSDVQLAFRANDTTDVWAGIRHNAYRTERSRPFRSADLRQVARPDALALYSITFNNDIESDLRSLEAFAEFRREAMATSQRYFLEVFNPNADCGIAREDIGVYVNDCTLRMLAGLTRAEQPAFLKVAFNGPAALEELAGYDPGLVVGLLGGGAGTTRDTFELVAQGERFGARIALFGRKISCAENERLLIRVLRRVADGAVDSAEGVRIYHDELRAKGIEPDRALADDLVLSAPELRIAAYGG